MPDKRKHRGAHPDDARLFAEQCWPALRLAVGEYSWLLTRGYAEDSALALVGNRHDLTERQRTAVRRTACSDQSLQRRQEANVPVQRCCGRRLGIDGYNLLITVESAMSGGPIFIARDGCCRDLASIHGTYRKVDETLPALRLIVGCIAEIGPAAVDWYLDKPVSNSGRLKVLLAEIVESAREPWNIELLDNPDLTLSTYEGVAASSDSWILDRCAGWANLACDIIDRHVPAAWRIAMTAIEPRP